MEPTYAEIQKYVRDKYGRTVKTCWIADVRRKHGLPTRVSPRRSDLSSIKNPYPADRRSEIENAFRYFGLL